MAYVETAVGPSTRWGMSRPKRRSVLKCDACGKRYDVKYCRSVEARTLHFCSRSCVNIAHAKGGVIDAAKVSRSRVLRGVDYAAQAVDVRKRIAERNMRRFGSTSPFGSVEVQRKVAWTFVERYGQHPSRVDGVKRKMLETRVERYGTVAPIHGHEGVASRYAATMYERYGVESPLQSEALRSKARETCLSNNGVANPLQGGSKFREGVDYASAGMKGYRALVKKGDLWMISKPEQELMTLLHEWFGADDVEHQVEVGHGTKRPWLVDFYVKSIDTYVELDGDFWHGLKDDTEHARLARLRDQQRNAWFAENDMRLVRVLESELKGCQRCSDFSGIHERLGG